MTDEPGSDDLGKENLGKDDLGKVDIGHEDELKSLDERLNAISARKVKSGDLSSEIGANQGYQALGELIGGILGGLGLGWLFDHFVGTKPIGIIIGTILGMFCAVYVVAKSSSDSDKKPPAKGE